MPATTKKTWIKITLAVPSAQSDTVASLLALQTGAGIEQTPGPADGQETLTAYIEQGPKAETCLAAIRAVLQGLSADSAPPELTTELLPDADWNAEWKKHFKPLHVTPSLVIVPSWEPYTAQGNENIIVLDPGMAFGTGHHESTRLALLLLEELRAQGVTFPTALDVGTGTGILAMAAALSGAERVIAIDNDPEAVTVAQENLAANKLQSRVEVSGHPLDAVTGAFPLVMANITSDVLIAMAPALTGKLAAGGHLILAGILAGPQEDEVCRHYVREGCENLRHCRDGEWAALLLRRP